jgi:hypothetical protein
MRYILALLALLSPLSASAAMMPHYDLASLWHLSDEVVLAEEVSHTTPPAASWNRTTTYRITKVYKGALSAGGSVEVYDDAYRLELPRLYLRTGPGAYSWEEPPARSPQAVLFLIAAPAREGAPAGKLYQKVFSGMRLIGGGKVYRVEQQSNPGPYEPVPQGPDPLEVAGQLSPVPGSQQPVEYAAFESDLLAAADRVKQLESALALTGAARTKALLALLPAPRVFPAEARYYSGFFVDRFSVDIRAEILRGGDLGALLEAMGRDVDGLYSTFEPRELFEKDAAARAEYLRQAAFDETLPTYLRDAAIRSLAEAPAGATAAGLTAPTLCEELGRLLGAKDAFVRLAAADVLGRSRRCAESRAAVKLLEKAAAGESEPAVLLALGRAMERRGAAKSFRAALPAASKDLIFAASPGPAAGRRAESFDLGYEFLTAPSKKSLAPALSAKATDKAGAVVESEAAEIFWARGGESGAGVARFPWKTRLAPGTYSVEVTIKAERGGKTLERTSKVVIEVE